MSAPRFFVERLEIEPGSIIRLSAQDSRHALRSLRLRRGDELSIADGRGRVASARLLTERGGGRSEEAQAEVLEVRWAIRPAPSVSVAMAPPKGDRLSWAVQKLGELGVDGLALLQTERSVRTLDADRERSERSLERLRNVAREAAMQSRQAFVMEVDGASSMEDALGTEACVVMLWEEATAPLASLLPPDANAVRLLVGPEGGFGADDLRRAREAGAGRASLGPSILRTETAAIVGASLVLARYGRLG